MLCSIIIVIVSRQLDVGMNWNLNCWNTIVCRCELEYELLEYNWM